MTIRAQRFDPCPECEGRGGWPIPGVPRIAARRNQWDVCGTCDGLGRIENFAGRSGSLLPGTSGGAEQGRGEGADAPAHNTEEEG